MTIQTALAQLRHLYAQMLTWSDGAANCALGLLGPAIAALEVGTDHIESDLVKTSAELVACEMERDAMVKLLVEARRDTNATLTIGLLEQIEGVLFGTRKEGQ